ncbi:MAG: GtrA family protein [Methylocystis sp.]
MTAPAEPARIPGNGWRSLVASSAALVWRILREHRLSRFILVGGFNTAVGYSLFLAALAIMPTTFSALVVANILAISFNFLTTGSLVFGARDPRRLPRFFGVYGVVFAYNWAGLSLLESIGVHAWLGGLVLLPGAVAVSYFLNQRFVFGGSA